MEFDVPKFDTLVLSGGAYKGVAQLGVLHCLKGLKGLENIQTFCGTSIGSMICLLLILNYTPYEIYTYRNDVIFKKPSLKDIFNFTQTYGFLDISTITTVLTELVKKKLDNIPTLKELFDKTGKHFVAVVSNISHLDEVKTEYLSHLTYPDMSCVDAVMYSCNLPFIFHKLEPYAPGKEFIDGGFGDNFPLSHVDLPDKVILGINTPMTHQSDISPVLDYFLRIAFFSITQLQKERNSSLSNLNTKKIFNISVNSSDSVALIKDETLQKKLFMEGFHVADQEFRQKAVEHNKEHSNVVSIQ